MKNLMKRRAAVHKTGLEWAKKLAEAIMLQAIEDLCLPDMEKEGMEFFDGEGFADCADIIGMSLYDRRRVLKFVRITHESMVHLYASTM